MELLERLGDALAKDVLEAAERLGDETIVDKVSSAVGASSTTLQEAFLTAVRIRRAEAHARRVLAELVARAEDGGTGD
ncbi:MAG: hypothetical protein D6688_12945 [Alphaproteobacteria bacterium]|nr:MAG: hypothetical protein D6688_12945 [Alphaproteobacteria bacterium]